MEKKTIDRQIVSSQLSCRHKLLTIQSNIVELITLSQAYNTKGGIPRAKGFFSQTRTRAAHHYTKKKGGQES
jgi:hypothetical protein